MIYRHYYTKTDQPNTINTCVLLCFFLFFASNNTQTVSFCVIMLKERTALRKLFQWECARGLQPCLGRRYVSQLGSIWMEGSKDSQKNITQNLRQPFFITYSIMVLCDPQVSNTHIHTPGHSGDAKDNKIYFCCLLYSRSHDRLWQSVLLMFIFYTVQTKKNNIIDCCW